MLYFNFYFDFNLTVSSIYLLKITLYYICFVYAFIFSEHFDNTFYTNFSSISKNININNSFNSTWLNYFIIISTVTILLISGIEVFTNVNITKLVVLLSVIYFFSFYVFNNFFFWNSYCKFNPNIFIILVLPLVINVFFYKSYIIIILSLEYLSVCTISYISSFFYKNLNGLLSYIWSSIFSAILIFLWVTYTQQRVNNIIYDLTIISYFSIKVGLMPLGFWLYYFYNDININNIINYLSFLYIINIVFVMLFILCSSSYSIFYYKDILTLNTIKTLILSLNLIVVNFFYFNSNFKKILFINTLTTSIIIFSIFL